MKKCIVIPDSYKGTLTAAEFCHIAQEEIKAKFADCEVVLIPVADGGEGTVDCFALSLGYERVAVEATGPFGERLEAYYAKKDGCAVVELAMCAGLPLAASRLNPSLTTTYGVGQVIKKAVMDGCKKIILGLGGSCTNDCGAGMAAALGTRFFDAEGKKFVPTGGELHTVVKIDTSETQRLLCGCEIVAMCDIDNPLCGEHGAAYIFAPQKGADSEMTRALDRNLQTFAGTIKAALGVEVASLKGAGAAGGAGAGVVAFLGGELRSGIDTVLELVHFDRELEGTDIVFTGEGRLDGQSLDGKAIVGIARRAAKKSVPVIAVVGAIGNDACKIYSQGVSAIFSINTCAEAFETSRFKTKENLRTVFDNILRLYDCAYRDN
ncbi:MAG: glycerate kinase [Oscillospiraceae bacterium]